MRQFLLCLCFAVLRLSSALSWQTAKPVVSGTESLDPEEMSGERPIFVDAFLNQIGSNGTAWGARIILSYNPAFNCSPEADDVKDCPREWWGRAQWGCRWRERGLSLARLSMEEEAEVLHDSRGLNESVRGNAMRRVQSNFMRHALVVACRLPPALAHLQEWKLDVTATLGGQELYSRRAIPVRLGAFVRQGTELALCTMVNSADDMLWPWAKFHAQAGFDQILIYVEEADIRPVAEQVKDLVQEGLVTLVPFFFGEISLKRNFYMQPSMEQHCLYQAKGRAAWLGHNDIDEFFEPRGAVRNFGLKDYLRSLPKDTPGVVVRGHLWLPGMSSAQRMRATQLPFPCGVTCRAPGSRTKWIARADMVQIIDPHSFASSLKIIFPNPESELRLDHFRHCRRGGPCTVPPWPCKEDHSFVDYCSARLGPVAQ